MTGTEGPDGAPDRIPTATLVGVGCLTGLAGMFGGGMIAVLVAKIVGSVRGCAPLEGTPACDWNLYAVVGMAVGLLLLPLVSIIRLRGRRS